MLKCNPTLVHAYVIRIVVGLKFSLFWLNDCLDDSAPNEYEEEKKQKK